MTGKNTDKFSAGEQGLGYIYQIRLALLQLLQYPEDTAVHLEKDDDLDFIDDKGGKSLASLKHKAINDRLTDLSTDFWKSVNIWLARYKRDGCAKSNLRFFLFTTGLVSSDSFLTRFLPHQAVTTDDIRTLTELADAALVTSASKLITPIAEAFNELNSLEKQDFLERILILDGAMGTEIQGLGLTEDDFRGERFLGCACHQQGNNDLLILTQPNAIEDIHFRYAMAGADIVETNTFSSTTIAQADYGLEAAVHDLNVEGARIVRRALDRATAIDGKPRFVAGAIGPTNRTASLSPDVSDPGYRAVSFDDLRIAYGEQVRGLIAGGADLILIETIFDTLNAKAAIFACFEAFAEHGQRLPLMISGTITDASGRTLSGQTPTAFLKRLTEAWPTRSYRCHRLHTLTCQTLAKV